jgi:hypothetical protein
MPNVFTPGATKLLKLFQDRKLLPADFVLPEQLQEITGGQQTCSAALTELAELGYIMLGPFVGPIPAATLTEWGFKRLKRMKLHAS